MSLEQFRDAKKAEFDAKEERQESGKKAFHDARRILKTADANKPLISDRTIQAAPKVDYVHRTTPFIKTSKGPLAIRERHYTPQSPPVPDHLRGIDPTIDNSGDKWYDYELVSQISDEDSATYATINGAEGSVIKYAPPQPEASADPEVDKQRDQEVLELLQEMGISPSQPAEQQAPQHHTV